MLGDGLSRKRKSADQATPSSKIDLVARHGATCQTFEVNGDRICESSLAAERLVLTQSPKRRWSIFSSRTTVTVTITITDHLPRCVELYTRWLAGRELYSTRSENLTESARKIDLTLEDGDKSQQIAACLHFMAEAWLLGEDLQDSRFQNAIMSTIIFLRIDKATKIQEETIAIITIKCAVGSGLYRWLVDTLACIYTGPQLTGKRRNWSMELRHEMMELLMTWAENSTDEMRIPSRASLPRYRGPTIE